MIGHDTARRYLERELPRATLLHGPRSIGKWTLAQHLANHHRVMPVDRWEIQHGLSIETVRLITSYAARAPRGQFKLIIARIDEASRPALNALLKTLEEPPPHVRFLLINADRTLPTVASRCTVFELGILTPEQIEAIYRSQQMPAAKAHRAAVYARGSIQRGYDLEQADRHRTTVTTLAKAIATSDRELYVSVFEHWDGRCTDFLHVMLTEALTGRWNTFREDDLFGLHHDRTRLWRMVAALARLPAARPKLGVRATFEPFLSR